MYDLTHRVCSNCLFWSMLKEPHDGLIYAICEKTCESKRGSDKCGQWKKIEVDGLKYNPVYDGME